MDEIKEFCDANGIMAVISTDFLRDKHVYTFTKENDVEPKRHLQIHIPIYCNNDEETINLVIDKVVKYFNL